MLTRKPRLLRSRRVRFNNKAMASSYDAAEPGKTSKDIVDAELTSAFCSIRIPTAPMVPDLFTNLPLVRDALETPTLALQNQTVEECLPFLSGEGQLFEKNENGVPRLLRESHARFLRTSLGRLPGRFVAADASRPWFLYWCLSGLTLLGQDVSCYRQSLAETVRSLQNLPGGFGGGSGQLSHLATTYAVVLSLALVGGEDCFEVVDRRALWKWLCSLKQPDGGFQVCLGGEEDIRGAYCAAVIIKLLELPLNLSTESPAWTEDRPNLFTGVPEYVRKCQTFEGGISAQPGTEAHGAYAFCALGCLSLLGSPNCLIPKYLDVPLLLSWLSSRQYAPEGGFSGRTNKLVDGCYSHWVGACFPLIDACLKSPPTKVAGALEPEFTPASESLFNREGLIRYILCCCQEPSHRGGLRDKPGKHPDPYHTCYVLSGLSSAQHRWEIKTREPDANSVWTVSPSVEGVQIFAEEDRVRPIHPVYAIPQDCQKGMRDHFAAKEGF